MEKDLLNLENEQFDDEFEKMLQDFINKEFEETNDDHDSDDNEDDADDIERKRERGLRMPSLSVYLKIVTNHVFAVDR